MKDAPALSSRQVFTELWTWLTPYRGRLALIVLALMIELGFNTAFPLSLKFIIDRAIGQHDGQLLAMLLLGLGVLFVLASLAGIGRKYVTAYVGAHTLNDMRLGMFDHLQRLSVGFYETAEPGDLLSRFTNDMTVIENALVRSLPLVALSALEVSVSAGVLVMLDWRLGLLTILLLPLAVLGPRLASRSAGDAGYRRKTNEAGITSAIEESIVAQALIKALRLEPLVLKRFDASLRKLADASAQVGFLTGLMTRTSDIGMTLVQLIVVALGAIMAFNGALSIGALFSFVGFLLSLGVAVFDFSQALPDWIQASGGLRRVDQLLNVPRAVVDSADAAPLAPLTREIQLDHVFFSYIGARPNLSDASLVISKGQRVAFVGRSGAGKSTILSLLLRFYDPSSGSILIDGEDLRNVTQESLRRQLAMVFQQPILFRGTIRENILLGKPDATDEEVIAAAQAADIHETISELQAGYDTPLGANGAGLSGGQRQRIALARALVDQPPVLLLDEVTSALDPQTEAAINATLEGLSNEHTIIAVTHRLASVVQYDRIYVMADGHVAEHGSHTELLRLGGLYTRLWQEQAGFKISRDGRTAAVSSARLAAIPFFSRVSDSHLKTLADRFVSEQYDPNEIIMREGDSGDKFYTVVRGQVDIIRGLEGASPQRVAALQDGDFFGEIALLRGVRRTASVRSRGNCLLLSLSREDFLDLVAHEPELATAIEATAAARIEANAA
ncbi:MAG: ABC transporter transmembrane domain-containing protein [Chloroflexota bacterium]